MTADPAFGRRSGAYTAGRRLAIDIGCGRGRSPIAPIIMVISVGMTAGT
jgi:hypothetical protein